MLLIGTVDNNFCTFSIVPWSRLGDPFVSQNLKEFCVAHFLRRILDYAYNRLFVWSNKSFLNNSQLIHPGVFCRILFFALIYGILLFCDGSFRLYHLIVTSAILLCLIYFCFGLLIPYGFVLRSEEIM